MNARVSAIALLALLTACGDKPEPVSQSAVQAPAAVVDPVDTVFYGDHILTMDKSNADAEAVAIDGDRIVFVGSRADADAYVDDSTRRVELGDRALAPGLIDAHGHFMFISRLADVVQLYPPPTGDGDSVEKIVELMRERLETDPPADGEWLAGFGYDDSLLAEGRHPNRHDLDQVSTDIPVVIVHVSGHLASANSKALEMVGYNADTPDPEGGVIRREADGQPNGVLEETASQFLMFKIMAGGDSTEMRDGVDKAINLYASMGITTVQDGATTMADLELMRDMAAKRALAIDLAMFPLAAALDDQQVADLRSEPTYSNGVRLAGAKFLLDGSPQGRTAWMTHPYNEGPPGAHENYTAYAAYDPALYNQRVATMLHNGVPILAHANGDAAIDAMLDGIAGAYPEGDIPDHRAVIIHAQLMRRDQIDRALALRAIPSFFSAHTFFWGDWHRRSFGEERASGISPTGSALEKGLRFTVHNDSPVVLPDMMRLLWATVNRTTRSGFVLGRGERISAEQGLRAMTIDAAYQYFEEDQKGSLTVGKQADLVVLSDDPTTVNPEAIADIKVLETIAHGETVYSDQSASL